MASICGNQPTSAPFAKSEEIGTDEDDRPTFICELHDIKNRNGSINSTMILLFFILKRLEFIDCFVIIQLFFF